MKNDPIQNIDSNQTYQKLARHLDDMPGGFPSTESGIELKILRRFFNPDEAALALHVTLIPEEPKVIARRAKISFEEAVTRLAEMAKKGLIFRIGYDDTPPKYMSNQMVIGIWEYHVNDLDEELIKDMSSYSMDLIKEAWKVPQLRTIPVNQSITAQMEITTYEKAEELIRRHSKIVVAPCICRRERSMMGEGCDAPEESCLVFGLGAEYYQQNGLGREIDREEALQILTNADKAGLVLQPGNAQKVANICCCCGCCCAVLRTLKKFPDPAKLVSSPFHIKTESESCNGCGICIERCPMDALILIMDKSNANLNRCIGCGLCVTTCPTDSLTLVRKPESEQPEVPKNNIQNYINLGRIRGKLTTPKMVIMQIKSKVDRLLALK